MGRTRAHDGASAVEFALVLPVLVLFIFGIIVFGMAFVRAQGMEAAAREGGRVAAVAWHHHDSAGAAKSEVDAAVRDAALPLVDPNHLEVELAVDGGGGGDWCQKRGDRVRLSTRIAPQHLPEYELIIPLWPGSAQPDYESFGVFRCEAGRDD